MSNAAGSVFQDSALGRIVRFVTRNKVFAFPEDDPNFKIPWERASATDKEKAIDAGSAPVSQEASNATSPGFSPDHSMVEGRNVEPRGHSDAISTRSSADDAESFIMRTLTRERTLPGSIERYDVELQEALERQKSRIIKPQRTSEGVIIVDWYTTDDPANPQNWTSLKKAWVGLIIFVYTFAVYMASAIYTSAQPQVMEKFGIGQSKGSLLLSMYVIGYGLGPMVSFL